MVLAVDIGYAVVVGVDFLVGFCQPVLAVSGAKNRGGQQGGDQGCGQDAYCGVAVVGASESETQFSYQQ